MRKIILFLLFSFMGLCVMAQNISVKSFRPLVGDMTTTSAEGKRIDQNGEVAALIKVVTPETGFVFEGGTLGIVGTQQRVSEIWVWVPRASRKITILHQQLGQLRDYRFPVEIEADRTYEMVLTTAKVETIVKEEVRMQYLAFQITPPNAVLTVNEELWEVGADGTAMKFVDFGTYTYRVQAPNYHPDAGKVVVDNPKQAHRVTVNLVPDFVEVTLKVDADAEIWVNDEKKGTRSWTGSLGKGSYKIECKQAGHEATLTTQKITAEMDGQTITLTAPRPIYGSLNVESSPFATLYIDGKVAGETPCFIPEILVGQHEIKIAKEGYADHVETIVIDKGERKQVSATMNKKQEITQPAAATPTNNSSEQTFTVNGVSFTMKQVEGSTFKVGADVDDSTLNKLVQEAYQRKLKDIRASHILISCDKHAMPSDTLKAYNKALDIRKRAMRGEDFGDLAVRYSDDPSAKDTPANGDKPARPSNRGDLGYFSVFDMVYPFETGAYNTKEGELSMPVRTEFGYHIIKVTSVTDALGSIQAAHIFLQLPFDASEKEVSAMKQKADNIYKELMDEDGKNWADKVRQYTDDKGTIARDGALTSFTVSRIIPEFIEACKSLEVGQIAKPVRSFYGFHIVKLLSKTGVGSFESESKDLTERVEMDIRSWESYHYVTLSDYWMGEAEVTQALWKAVMGSNPSNIKGDNLPVEQVSWNDCQEFIRKLNQKTGKQFRLPTETEWEYAARGGKENKRYKYSGSNTLRDVAWFGQWNGETYDNGNSGEMTHTVKSKSPNNLGLYDMSGNVWEWCYDWYGSDYYGKSPTTNPQGPSSGSNRVLRGGSWSSRARECRVSYRHDCDPDLKYKCYGFRLALSE